VKVWGASGQICVDHVGARRLTLSPSSPLAFVALLGCTGSVVERRAETAAPPWTPQPAEDAVQLDTGSATEGNDELALCFEVPDVDGEGASETFEDGSAWLPAGPDFDFDADGYVVTMVGEDLVRFDRAGAGEVVVRRVGFAWGVRSLPTGELVISRPELGMTALIGDDGAPRPFLGGMGYPTALEVGVDGRVYIADDVVEGVIWMADPYTGEVAHVVDVPFPSGLALSPDERTLYIATASERYPAAGRIAAVDRGADGAWDPSTLREIHRTEGRVDAMTTDVCGNLYLGEHDTARLFRIRAVDGLVEEVAVLGGTTAPSGQDQGLGLTALRFGAGAGGFPEDSLYTSAGGVLFGLAVGVDGRHVLSAQ
jgi:hypothetical protein